MKQEDDKTLKYDKKERIDKITKGFFLACAILCGSFVIFIIVFLLIKGFYPFFHNYSVTEGETTKQSFVAFFTSSRWLYNGTGGMIFLLLTTIYTTILSLLISVPTSIFTALFIVRIAPKQLRIVFQTYIELLASIPSVIYGLFGLGVICPIINKLPVETFGGSSILSAVIILALMSIPTITLLSITALETVSKKMVNASLALGASETQTNFKIVLRCAKSGIFAGIILGTGRALGEATAVQMVIGNGNNGSGFLNIFNIGNTLTSAMLSGIGEASGIGYDTRFSLGLILILVTLLTSFLLNLIKKKMIEKETGMKKVKHAKR